MNEQEIAKKIKSRLNELKNSAGISQQEIADKTGINRGQLSRMLSTGHMRLDQACMIAKTVGCEIVCFSNDDTAVQQERQGIETLRKTLDFALRQVEWLRTQIDRLQDEKDNFQKQGGAKWEEKKQKR